MRRSASLFPILLLLSLCLPAPTRAELKAGARGTYWFPDLSATAQTITAGTAETKLDAKTDLGVGDEDIPSGELFLRAGRITFRAGYMAVRYDGSNTLRRAIVFNGQTFSVSDHVASRLDVTMVDGEIQVDILRPETFAAAFHLGLLAKVKYVDGEVKLSSSSMEEEQDFRLPIPMLGVAAGVGFANNRVHIDARATGLAYSGNHLYEADAFASIAPVRFLQLQGGYRYLDLSVDDDLIADLTLKGPYVGVRLSF